MIRPEAADWVARLRPDAEITPLAGDASTRRFYRIRQPGAPSVVLVDYGQPFHGESDDVKLGRIFREAGLPVARPLDMAPELGCSLVEDLGDTTLERAVRAGGAAVPALLRSAIDLSVAIADGGTPVLARSERSAGPRLDADRFRFEMDFFIENYAVALRGTHPTAELTTALHDLADRSAASPRLILCHRDYHSRNLMVGADHGLTMVDIQDARWGPDTYDLASFVRDPYLNLGEDEDLVAELVDRYLSSLAAPPPALEFRLRLHLVAAQRMIKCLGTFGRQVAVLGRARYAEAIPPTARMLRTVLPRSGSTRSLGELLERQGLLEAS